MNLDRVLSRGFEKYPFTLQRTFLKRIRGYRKNILHFTTDIFLPFGRVSKNISSLYNGQNFWNWGGMDRKNYPFTLQRTFSRQKVASLWEKFLVMFKTRPFILQRTSFEENLAVLLKISPSPYNGHFWSELAGTEKIFLHFTTDNLDGFVSRFRKDLLINFYRVTDPGSNGHWYRETWDVMWKIPLHFTTDIF